MRRLFSSLVEFVEHAGLSLFATLVTAAVGILIIVTSWFWPPIYSFLESNHVFQALVLLMFIEVITLSIKHHEKNEELTVFMEETDAVGRLFEVVPERRVQRVRMLSAGLGSRWTMVDRLLRARVRVQVLVQDPDTAIDKRDASHTLDNVHQLQQVAHAQNADLLIRLNVNVATVRAVILYEPNDRVKHLFFGWYTYGIRDGSTAFPVKSRARFIEAIANLSARSRNSLARIETLRNIQVDGSPNPTLYVSSDSAIGKRLCEWVERLMDAAENEARDVPVDKTSSFTQHKT